jgi:hypothetical protein
MTVKMRRLAAIACIWLLSLTGTPASGASITVVHQEKAGALVGIEGDLELADGEKFANLIRPLGNAVVLFNSRGGSLLAGLRIGQIIHSRGFGTLVPDGDVCASACALAWVGGARRLLGPKAHLGFHAAYMDDGGNGQVSSSGNALVGAYLDRLGLADDAIYALTDAAPNDIRWVDTASANQLGIATSEFRLDDTGPIAPPSKPVGNSPRQRSLALVNAYFSAGSAGATSAIEWMSSHYGGSINFYGKATPLGEVIKQKIAFVRRWPERLYVPVNKSLTVVCAADQQSCRVTGNVQYECRSYVRGAHSAGLASFALTVNLRSRSIFTEESGAVIQRR